MFTSLLFYVLLSSLQIDGCRISYRLMAVALPIVVSENLVENVIDDTSDLAQKLLEIKIFVDFHLFKVSIGLVDVRKIEHSPTVAAVHQATKGREIHCQFEC